MIVPRTVLLHIVDDVVIELWVDGLERRHHCPHADERRVVAAQELDLRREKGQDPISWLSGKYLGLWTKFTVLEALKNLLCLFD